MSVFLRDYTEKDNKGYHLDNHGNLCVLTKTNGGISHNYFIIDCVRQVESIVIQLWEGAAAEPIAKVVGQTEPDSDAHPVHAKKPPPPLALCWDRNKARSREGKPTTVIAVGDGQLGQDSDGHPVDTPIWDQFLKNLQLASDDAAGRDFIEFIQNHCFSGNLLWKDTDGNWVDEAIPLALKMEILFDIVWRRRQLALERLRKEGMDVDDDEHELGADDMKTLWQLR